MQVTKNRILGMYLGSFLLYETLCYLTNAMIMPAMLEVVTYLHAGKADISTTVIAYMVGVTITPLVIFPLAGIFGKVKIITFGCAIFALANLFCPFSSNMLSFSIFRCLQGMGQGFIFLGYTMIHESFDDISAVKLISLMANITITAPIMGPILGSFFVVSLGWKYVFWVTAGFAILALVGLIKWSPATKVFPSKFSFITMFKSYKIILANRSFILGVLIFTLAMMPSELWMIFSIIIVVNTLKLSLVMYNIYMMMILGASIFGVLILRRIINLVSFSNITIIGCTIYLIGSFMSIFAYSYDTLFVLFLALAVFGNGLFKGIVYRQIITGVHVDKNALSAIFKFSLSISLIIFIYCASVVFKYTNYSLLSFGIFYFITSIGCLILVLYFIRSGKLLELKEKV